MTLVHGLQYVEVERVDVDFVQIIMIMIYSPLSDRIRLF